MKRLLTIAALAVGGAYLAKYLKNNGNRDAASSVREDIG